MLAKIDGQEIEGDTTETVKSSEVLRPVNAKMIKDILSKRDEASESRSEINKDVRTYISERLGEKVYLDRAMLPVVEKLWRMDDDAKVAYHLDNLLHMLDVAGINARAEKVARLPLGDKKRSAAPPKDMQPPTSIEGG
jgi:hypothetical protein